MKNLYFDESGFTGTNLLDSNQPYFCYLGIDSNDFFEKEFLKLKEKYGYNLQEVKGMNLCKSNKGHKLILELWNLYKDNVKYVVHNKKYGLAAKIFEYVYEPVFADYNTVLYNSGFHIFFASFLYSKYFLSKDESAESIFNGFFGFIKTKKQTNFLSSINCDSDDIFIQYFIDFCNLYNSKIAGDVSFENTTDTWLLDLSATSLFNLLGSFQGDGIEELNVVCDNSKPINAFKSFLDAEIGNTNIAYAGLRGGKKHRLTFNLAEEIKMGDSKNCLSLQIADLLVSSINYSFNHMNEDFSKNVLSISGQCFQYDISVLPDFLPIEYSENEIVYYLEIMYILSVNVPVRKKMLYVSYLSQIIPKQHRFDLLKHLP